MHGLSTATDTINEIKVKTDNSFTFDYATQSALSLWSHLCIRLPTINLNTLGTKSVRLLLRQLLPAISLDTFGIKLIRLFLLQLQIQLRVNMPVFPFTRIKRQAGFNMDVPGFDDAVAVGVDVGCDVFGGGGGDGEAMDEREREEEENGGLHFGFWRWWFGLALI